MFDAADQMSPPAADSAAIVDVLEVCQAHKKLLDGKYVDELSANLSANLWRLDRDWKPTLLPLSRAEKYEMCKHSICVEGSCRYRLHFKLDVPKYHVLCACAEEYDAVALGRSLASVVATRDRCEHCLDKAFSKPALEKLTGPRSAHYHRIFRYALACMKIASIRVEAKHLLGQETRPGKRRGKALTPQGLALRTYRKSVRQAFVAKRAAVSKLVLGKKGKRMFMHLMQTQSQQSRTYRRPKDHTVATSRAMRRTSAQQLHKRANWRRHVRPGTPAGVAEAHRIRELWRDLRPAAKHVYEEQAQIAIPAQGQLARGAVAAPVLLADTKHARQRIRRARANHALAPMKNPPHLAVWSRSVFVWKRAEK